ncbi:MAG TPA: PAS domain S-box protein [Mucilaginibacter sp.]|nr:PAS domain S-box protein [Mucilaginibacter sp.]
MLVTEDKVRQLEDELNRLKEQVRQTAMIQREKDRLESEYQRSQKRFRTVFEESVIGKKIIDDQLRIVKVNRAVLAMLGYSENELTGKLITDFAQAYFIPRWKELQEELWTNERPSFSFDTCLIKKDGTSFWCHITTIIIEDNGDRLGYTILEDISERKSWNGCANW